MLTDEQLAEIEARANAATGPRLIAGEPSWAGQNAVLTEEGHPVAACGEGKQAEADSRFFAHSRADVPTLLAEVKRLRKDNAWLDRHYRQAQEADEALHEKVSAALGIDFGVSWDELVAEVKQLRARLSGWSTARDTVEKAVRKGYDIGGQELNDLAEALGLNGGEVQC